VIEKVGNEEEKCQNDILPDYIYILLKTELDMLLCNNGNM